MPLVLFDGLSADVRGYGIGLTASSPNCASRKRSKRASLVDGSEVAWGWCLGSLGFSG